ncbi:hypothetical protein GCM10022419_046860 [Nonomuraea rosea]|uniref:Tetracyclin repressor-like C-terminal domain-containing protein n=1 Tax=Nonomuraea rosea TaxID=638574 RepID=A0ABP6X5L6_9ACTN
MAFAPACGCARGVGQHLNEELSGDGAAVRAELMLAIQTGVWLMRRVPGRPALTEGVPEEFADRIRSLRQVLA